MMKWTINKRKSRIFLSETYKNLAVEDLRKKVDDLQIEKNCKKLKMKESYEVCSERKCLLNRYRRKDCRF